MGQKSNLIKGGFHILQRLYKWFKNQRGVASDDTIIVLPFILCILTITPDLLHIGGVYLSAYNVSNHTIEMMELHGGMDEIVEADMNNWLNEVGLQPSNWRVEASGPGHVYGEKLRLKLRTEIKLLSFAWIGIEKKIPIEITKLGISRA